MYEKLQLEKEDINKELGIDVDWVTEENNKHSITLRRNYSDIRATENREEIKEFLKDSINRFVNVFRPRLERIVDEE